MRRALPSLTLLAALSLLTAGCPETTPPTAPDAWDAGADDVDDDGHDDGEASDVDPGDTTPPPPPPDGYLTTLSGPADLAALGKDGSDVKYLARVDGAQPPAPLTEACYFQDMNRFAWHFEFLTSFPELADLAYEAYVAMVMQRTSRVFWGGAVRAWPAVVHPRTAAHGVVSYVVYSQPGGANALTVDDVVQVDQALKACAPFATDLLVFVPSDPQQKQLAHAAGAVLAAQGVDVVWPEQLSAGLGSVAHSPGTGYGFLRVVPRGDPLVDYGPRDVVVVESAPNDISLVAGLVTADPQNEHSHVNLRLIEKGIPNATVPGIYDNPLVLGLDGQLVRIDVGPKGTVIRAASLAEAEAWWEAHRPTVPAPQSDLAVTAVASFADLGHDDAIAYGAKAANLAEIHGALPAPHRPPGFAIPFAAYAAFIDAAGLAPQIAALAADPAMRTDITYKRQRLAALRDAIRAAPFPVGLLAKVDAHAFALFGADGRTTRFKFRSSTNAEDLDALTGAGLYDSKSGCLADSLDGDAAGPSKCLSPAEQAWLTDELARRKAELAAHPDRVWVAAIIDDLEGDLTKERPVEDAVRKVWASLWNERAWDEREFYGLDHEAVYMGLAVNPSFVLERADAIAVTHLQVDAGAPVYRVVSQVGAIGVAQPIDPTAVAEVMTFRRDGDPPVPADLKVLVASSLSPDGAPLWSEADTAVLADLLFQLHDHFAANVYPHLAPLHLDVEIKLDATGQVVIKQARPYLTHGP